MKGNAVSNEQTAIPYGPEESFNATLQVNGGYVHVFAKNLDALIKTIGQLRPTEPVKAEPAKPKAAAPSPSPSESAASAASSQASASTDEAPRPTYDDVKKAVLAMAKISGDKALATLKSFTGQNGEPCDHGTKLKLEDYPAFLAAAAKVLDEVKA